VDCISNLPSRPEVPAEHLLRHCLALGMPARSPRPVKARLEEALGPELANKLVATLTIGSRRSA
jgi:hypothetical protein